MKNVMCFCVLFDIANKLFQRAFIKLVKCTGFSVGVI
ncbi:hypothetical protein SAMN05444407_103199 [Chryseobacterium contaminans]|uniref:Uncharacterized protein n=1 Tax=Chryseobacterium contaminans TaxID=1423959 RepID=A0A1M6ZED2_9FLAO|nr:hypothetical protein SAMN05444407_103199 [Chryseobacterium contaminans]